MNPWHPVTRRLRTPAARICISVLVGAVAGLVVFGVTQLSGRNLFVVTGAFAGAVSVLAFQVYGRAARLTEVRVTVPQLSELTFVVNNEAGTSASLRLQATGVEEDDNGQSRIYMVTDVAGGKAVLDGNHPLAGMALRFSLDVLAVRSAKPEEIAQGVSLP